jgi:trk system potassium uptake protein TrkA
VRVVIVGAGRAGISLAAQLSRAGHRVVVIERDEATARRAFEQFGLVTLTGDATDAALLREADVATADVVAAMLRRDADNLAVALLAREFGARRVMVRMRDVAYRGVYGAAGVQEVLSEIDELVGALATAVEHPRVRHSMVLGAGESVAFELVVPTAATVAGKTVREIGGDPKFPRDCVFAGVGDVRGAIVVPRGDAVVLGGAAVLLVARRDEVAAAIAFLTAELEEE